MLLSACSGNETDDALAVAKLPKSEIQAANYLPLNPEVYLYNANQLKER